jgi:hypothetical protein
MTDAVVRRDDRTKQTNSNLMSFDNGLRAPSETTVSRQQQRQYFHQQNES